MLRDDSGSGGGRPSSPRNVLGDRLDVCSTDPKTGFFRDGCCNTNGEDVGSHTVCAVMTAAFLEFSKSCGNDLSSPMPQFGFPGLRPGDRWCLCAPRWREAMEAGCAPRVVLRATYWLRRDGNYFWTCLCYTNIFELNAKRTPVYGYTPPMSRPPCANISLNYNQGMVVVAFSQPPCSTVEIVSILAART